MFVGELQLSFRAHHAKAFNAADLGFGQGEIDAGHIGAHRRENTFEAFAGIGRAADDLQSFAAGIDCQDLQFVRIRMRCGFDDFRHPIRGEIFGRVFDLFHFEPDAHHGLDNLVEGGVCLQMLLSASLIVNFITQSFNRIPPHPAPTNFACAQ